MAKKKQVIHGPFFYNNFSSFIEKKDKRRQDGYEVPLYSDANFIGNISDGLGPYQILNCVSLSKKDTKIPALILRVWRYRTAHDDMMPMTKTNIESYHNQIQFYHTF